MADLNEVDLFCLHSVFLPRINDVECWNNHLLSTSENLTPNQLIIEGALRQNMTPTLHIATHATSTIPRIPHHNDAVAVPRSTFIPCDNLQEELDQQDMLQVIDDFGYLVYRQVCHLVGGHLQQCNECS